MLHNGLYEPIINKSLAVLFLVIGFLHRELDRAKSGINGQQDNALRAVHPALDEGGQRHDNHDEQHDRQIEYKA